MNIKLNHLLTILMLLMVMLLTSCASSLVDKSKKYGISTSEKLEIYKKLAQKYPDQKQIKDIELKIIKLEFRLQGDNPNFKEILDKYSKWDSKKIVEILDEESYKLGLKSMKKNFALTRKRINNYLDAFPNGKYQEYAHTILNYVKESKNTYYLNTRKSCKDSKAVSSKNLFPTLKVILEGFGLTESDTLPGHYFTLTYCVTSETKDYIKNSDKRLYERGWDNIKTYKVPAKFRISGTLYHHNNNIGESGFKSSFKTSTYPKENIMLNESNYRRYVPEQARQKYYDNTVAALISVLTQTYGYESLVAFLKKRTLNRMSSNTARVVLIKLKPHITPSQLSQLKSLL